MYVTPTLACMVWQQEPVEPVQTHIVTRHDKESDAALAQVAMNVVVVSWRRVRFFVSCRDDVTTREIGARSGCDSCSHVHRVVFARVVRFVRSFRSSMHCLFVTCNVLPLDHHRLVRRRHAAHARVREEAT
jgi:hypothetical protein